MVKNGLVKGCSSLAKPMHLNISKRRRIGVLLFIHAGQDRVGRGAGSGRGEARRSAVRQSGAESGGVGSDPGDAKTAS